MLRNRILDMVPSDLGYWRNQVTASTVVNVDDLPASPTADDFQLLAENLPTLCWIARGDGYIFWYNKRWHDYCGSTPDAMEGWGWQSVHDPEELPRVMESWTQSIATGEAFEMIFPLRGNDGVFRRFLTRVVAVRNASDTVVRWIGTCTDIDDAKRSADQAELLSRELSHRIKNIFAVIAGLIGLSTYRDPDSKEFANRLGGRISALGRAHNFARPHSDHSRPSSQFTGLHGMLTELLSPYREDNGDRIIISGEDVRIDERSATPIALVIHELATNAVKYGALSATGGSVEIVTDAADEVVTICWKELGGPRILTPPAESGFGTQLSEISIEDQLGGKIERIWHIDGLEVKLSIDAARLRADL